MIGNENNTEARDRGYKDGYANKPPVPIHDGFDIRAHAYMDGHRLGRLAVTPAPDIEWPLDGAVKITVTRLAGNIYRIMDINSDRELTIKYNDQGRLLFNGHDIETEEYMAYVGLMDEVVERLGAVGVGTVTLDEEF
ncbi:MAG TPA: hypothetical protein VNS88_01755 [Nitrospiraceae bacterium]|nr:hypothetical protein [Nitrospiraceae bacterium]